MQPSTKPPSPAPASTTAMKVKPATVPTAAKPIRSTDDLIKEFPDQFMGIGRFPGKYKIWLLTWYPSHDTCPQEMSHCLASKGQGKPWQDGMPGSDHPHRWADRLGILHYLCSEGKWWAMPAFGSPWPQWGHLLRSSQDAHCGGSCSWVCALLLLHQVGCPPWILVSHPRPGLQPAYNIQQSLWKIPFPVTSLWPHLFPRHLPEEDGLDPQGVPRMYWNCRRYHHPQPHWGRTWCLPVKPHVDHLQIWLGVQSTENTFEGSSCQLLLQLPLRCWWCPPRPRKGWCSTHLASADKHHWTRRVLRPKSHTSVLSSLVCPPWLPLCTSCSRRTQTSSGTAPTMPLFSRSKKLMSVTPPSGISTLHFLWQCKSMPHR